MNKLLSIIILTAICSLVSGQQIAAIIEYTPAPGQFINTSTGSPSAAESLTNENGGLVSLGGYGGFIVLKLSESIENDPDNPYGVDFTIFGNALSFWSEPGIVEVMKDKNGNGQADETWYALAGSDHFFPGTIADYQISYTNPHSDVAEDVHWSDNQGVIGVIKKNVFQDQPYYPDPSVFPTIGKSKCEFTGRRISPVLDFSNPVQAVSHRRCFGYADNNIRIDPANPLPDNPYTAEIENSGGDGMDISWAIDETGEYIDLDEIDFIKIYTAVNADGGAIGEISTEISLVVDIEPAPRYPIPEKFIAIKGLPSKIIPEAYELEYSVFFRGRYKNDETVSWSVDGIHSYIDGNEYLLAEGEGKLILIATLDSDPTISTTISTEVYKPVDVSPFEKTNLEIYPNPVSVILTINQLVQGRIELISSQGKVVFSKETTRSVQQVNVSEYPSGIYLLRFTDKLRIESHKILIYK